MADQSAVYNVSIEGNAAAASAQISGSVVDAARAMQRFDEETKSLQADLRRLRGNSEEVTAAKKAMRAQLDQVRAGSTQLTMQLHRQGVSFLEASKMAQKAEAAKAKAVEEAATKMKAARDKDAASLKKSQERKDKTRDEQKGKGGIVGGFLKLRDKQSQFSDLKAANGGSSSAALKAMLGEARLGTAALQGLEGAAGSAMTSMAAMGAAGAATVVVGLAAATAGVIKFALAASDAAAKASRQREALLGNAKDAAAMGTQIDALAGKVPLGTEELNTMSLSLAKTRLSGKAMVDTMNAVAQATGAVDASAGAKLQEIITRGQNTGRMYIGRRELQGTGIDFDDVAKQYAVGTKKSVAAARRELMTGRATLGEGAEAIRKATEAKFGKLNKKNAFSLDEGPKKIAQAFTNLAKGVDLSPLTDGFAMLFEELSPNAPLGSAIKWMIETLGGGFVDIAGKAIPSVIEGFKWLMVGGLKVYTAFYELKKKVTDVFAAEGWAGLGKMALDGLIGGLKAGVSALVDAVKWVGKKVKGAFSDELEIHSPSRAFARFGKYSTQGYAQGVTSSAPQAQAAVQSMANRVASGAAEAPAAGPRGASSAAGGNVYHFHVGSEAAAEKMRDSNMLAGITKAVRDAYVTSGGSRVAA